MVLLFPNEEMELYEYNENEDIPDFFGESTQNYKLVGTYPCDFQNMSPHDSLKEYGKILQDTYKIYAHLDVPITDTMIIKLKNHPETYTITGTPMKYNHILPHTKILVTKQRKPEKLDG